MTCFVLQITEINHESGIEIFFIRMQSFLSVLPCCVPALPLQETNTTLFVPMLHAGQVPVNNLLIWGVPQ